MTPLAADRRETLYVTDAEIARRLGVDPRVWREKVRMFEADGEDFPRKNRLFKNKRYWPAVLRYLDHFETEMKGKTKAQLRREEVYT